MRADAPVASAAPWQAGAYVAGLFGTSALAWLGFVAVTASLELNAPGLLWFWYAPVPYILAWAILALPSVGWTMLSTFALASTNVVLAFAGFLIGLFSVGLLAPLVFVVNGLLLGRLAALAHGWSAPSVDRRAWSRIHGRGGLIAGAGLMASALAATPVAQLTSQGPYWRVSDYALLGTILALGFAWHAWAAWRQLRTEGYAGVPMPRVAALLSLAYLAPAAAFWLINPEHRPLAWPLEFQAAAAARKAERQAIAAAGAAERKREMDAKIAVWGTTGGRVLGPGEAEMLRLGSGGRIRTTAPAGWLANVGHAGFASGSAGDSLMLRPDPAQGSPTGGIVKLIGIDPDGRGGPHGRFDGDKARWRARAAVPGPGYYGPPAPQDQVYACRRRVEALDGLAACWALTSCGPPDERWGQAACWTPSSAIDAAAWLFENPAEVAMVTLLPGGLGGPLNVFGAGFRAACGLGATCTAQFSFDGAVVRATFPLDELHQWRRIRAEVNAVLGAATGRGLDAVPALLQPQGEVLPIDPP